MASRSTAKGAAKAKAPAEVAPTTAIVPLSSSPLAKQDDRGRPFIDIPFELRPEGGENQTDVRLTLPRMKVLQTNSVECKKETRVEGAEEGYFYNSASGETFEDFEGVALYMFQERYYNVPKMSANMVCTSRDGKGLYGTCLKGDYTVHRIPSKIIRDDSDREFEVGICDRCPHAARAYGQQSDCQHAGILVLVPIDFISKCNEIMSRIKADGDDGETVSEIINALCTMGFRSSSWKALNMIVDQGTRDLSYFKWSWVFNTFPTQNEKGSWYAISVRKNRKLTADELIFARSLYRLAQRIRPVITDVEVVDEVPQSETPVGDM